MTQSLRLPCRIYATYKPPNALKAKESSSNFAKFARQYGTNAYELEALEPETLQLIVREAIEGVLDTRLYNAELDAERADAAELVGKRKAVMEVLKGI